MASPSNEVRALLDQHDWNDTIPRLMKFALNRIRQNTWYSKRGGEIAAGKLAKDFVMDAIAKVYSGQRQWNPQSCPTLLNYLFGVVRSDINHRAESWENRSTVEQDVEPDFIGEETKKFVQQVREYNNSAMDQIIDEETKKEDEEYLSQLIDFLADDKPLIGIVECIMDGIIKPGDMATKLGVDIQEIYNMKKRMRRRLREYQGKNRLQNSMLMKGDGKNE